VTWARFQG